MGYFDLVIFCVDRRRRRRRFVVANFEARRMSSTLTEDLEELDYMTEREREGMWEGGSEESFAKDSVSIHTLFVFLNENKPFHVLC